MRLHLLLSGGSFSIPLYLRKMKTDKWKSNFLPFFLGLIPYAILFLMALLDVQENFIRVSLVCLLAILGFISGKLAGVESVLGVLSFMTLVVGGYFFMQLIQPDGLWIIGLLFLLVFQGVFGIFWLLGTIFHKPKA
jgi:hypothetical protein